MEIDPLEIGEDQERAEKDKAKSHLNAMVAVTIALLATFMGVCKVKDDNIVQAMQQAQAHSIDYWATFHAKSTEAKVLEGTASLLRQMPQTTGAAEEIARSESKAQEELKEKDEWQSKAKAADDDYDKLNYRDDQFDLSDTLIALAVSMLAVTALTGKRWLYWIAMVPTALGVLMGLAGLLQWRLHPDAITNLLSMWIVGYRS